MILHLLFHKILPDLHFDDLAPGISPAKDLDRTTSSQAPSL